MMFMRKMIWIVHVVSESDNFENVYSFLTEDQAKEYAAKHWPNNSTVQPVEICI